ncbi:NADH:flavin oxidoreductase/NADH oxidase [Acinetobacter sp. B5B]|uniref:NADH:flavin oxidoreductase/NADH oxidase n=1 Tax=Acinetobacter baretiae TaxID=2605383 RepID=UPI0018C1DB2F|nr:NADH:flavin oxidoreductase/NADH oxidase [Acinetobacter baretiae]MBF7683202.1 NADH:flavin oxidoreductase/NADH oxidase [Acinetobacter baretiae]MBF7684433.1 NADH:flavin oxidoreductase/NADH oxidase [Acinetobacter baretiae]
MSELFQSIAFDSLTLDNKIIIAPMCQYSAVDEGCLSYWHEQQWASYALSGAGLCIVEATAVHPAGRISYADLGLWNDDQAERMKALLHKIRAISPMPFAIQLAHAGRKASTELPWRGRGQIAKNDVLGWQTVAPSPIPFSADDAVPHELSIKEIKSIQQDFVAAAQRAVEAGFSLIELHAAHGYLLHQFLSPLSNHRTDEYGGSLENRVRMLLETFQAIKEVVPTHFPIGVRVSATDWMQVESWDTASTIYVSQVLQQLGAAYIHVSSGGLHEHQVIDVKENYQVPFAQSVKEAVHIPVIAVGLITAPQQAEDILKQQQADAIALGRVMQYNPRWPWHAAATLGAEMRISPQYMRCQPHGLKDFFKPFRTS